jgi:hypothetical protein
MERRLHSRINSKTKVRLYCNGHGRIDGHLSDFSQSGISVKLDSQCPLPQMGDVIFMLADNMDEPYSMTVVRCDNQEWALMFNDE